ncbi:MAG: hypothetical protein ABI894_12565 [Ilumatobacteraceae bacterium]
MTTADTTADWRTSRLAMGIGLTVLAFALRAPTLVTRFFDPDEAAIGVQGMVVRAGGTLYTDIYDRKPPLPPLLYAASFSLTDSTDVRPMRVLVTVLLAAAGLVVAMDCLHRYGPRHAWLAGVMTIAGAMSLFPSDAGAANYAHFALLPGTIAIVLARRGTLLTAIGAGLAIGVAILCRQSWLLGVVPACVSIGLRGRWRYTGPFLAAAAATVATTGFYAPLGSFWEWNVTNSPGFVFASTSTWAALGRGIASVLGFAMFHPVIIGAVGASAVATVAAIRRRSLPVDIDLWLWVASGLAAWAAGLRFFGHYWLQVLPPLVLLALPIVVDWTRRGRAVVIVGIAVPMVAAWILLFVPGSFHHRPNPTALADYIRSHTTSSDRVFVWGSYPEVLVAARRLPAGDLVHTDFVVGRSGGRNNPAETLASAIPGAAEIMLDSLAADPPEMILDTSTAPNLGYENYPTSLIPELERFIHDGYQRITSVDGVDIWQRRE